MNDQVKRFFAEQKFLRMMGEIKAFRESLREYPTITLFNEVIKEDLKLRITDDDLKWVHYVLVKTQKLGSESPPPWRLLSARYALLHKAPLHDYKSEWDKKDNTWKVYEGRKEGDYSMQTSEVAVCNDEMRRIYADSNDTSIPPRSYENDEMVTKWWMAENKDCTHFDVNYSKKGTIPNPQVKIVRRGTRTVDLGFRKSADDKSIRWNVIRNIQIDMNKFRNQAKEQGYEDIFGNSLLTYTGWRDLLEPFRKNAPKTSKEEKERMKKEGIPLKAGGDNPAYKDEEPYDWDSPDWHKKDPEKRPVRFGTKKPKTIPDYDFNPAHQRYIVKTSETYTNLYKTDSDFRTYIEKATIAATRSALKKISGANASASITFSPDTYHKVKVFGGFGLSESDVRDMLQDTSSYLASKAGFVSDDHWERWDGDKELDTWVKKKLATGARNSMSKYVDETGQRAPGSGDPGASAGGGERHGGHEDLAASQGGSGDVASTGGKNSFQQIMPGDLEGREEIDTIHEPHEVLDYIKKNKLMINDPTLTKNPKVRAKVIHLAKTDAQFAALAHSLGLVDDKQSTVDKYSLPRDNDQSTVDKYTRPHSLVNQEGTLLYTFKRFMKNKFHEVKRVELPKPSSVLPYSFKQYISEMGVVWGNDNASAKQLKPGQTLKGGIQVQGAPWTAGGSINKKDNDIKVN